MEGSKFIENEDSFSEEFGELRGDILDLKNYTTGALGTLMEDIAKKEFHDSHLGEVIGLAISQSVTKVLESNLSVQYFDKELGSKLSESITEALVTISKLSRPTIDFSPMVEISSEVARQNKVILELLYRMMRSSTDESRYKELLKTTLAMIEKSERFYQKGLQQIDYSKELKSISDGVSNKIKKWELIVSRDSNQRINKVEATAK